MQTEERKRWCGEPSGVQTIFPVREWSDALARHVRDDCAHASFGRLIILLVWSYHGTYRWTLADANACTC